MSRNEMRRLQHLGFRKWHERQLIQGHVFLVLALLAVIALASGLELSVLEGEKSQSQWLGVMARAAVICGGAWIAFKSIKAYQRIMIEAEMLGEQATCPNCARYGFVLEELPKVQSLHGHQLKGNELDLFNELGSAEKPQLQVMCKKCSTRWQVSLEPEGA